MAQGERIRLSPPNDDLELMLRVNSRARRVLLKIDAMAGEAVLVCPNRGSRNRAIAFAGDNATWVRRRLAAAPEAVPFADGVTLPLLGRPTTIRHDPAGRRGVIRDGDEIRVSGEAAHLPRRLADWLRGEARRELADRAGAMAARLGVAHSRITVRDPRSRWGSCAPSGALSFSWRLVLAPDFVLDYVVAHEVAHLVEANHGPDFWALVAELHSDVPGARAWLKANGAALHRYGQ